MTRDDFENDAAWDRYKEGPGQVPSVVEEAERVLRTPFTQSGVPVVCSVCKREGCSHLRHLGGVA